MISFFPEPYPDELLYSLCSRYHERAGYRSRESTGRDLFGSVTAKVAYDLPCNLDSLVAALPLNHRYSSDRFIDDHTLLAFYGPFIPVPRLQLLREDMRGRGGGAIYGRIGILTSGVEYNYFRFCPVCVKADRTQFGETYWHRLHQIPGVEVCPTHEAFLEHSNVHLRNRSRREHFVTAERAVFPKMVRKININERGDGSLLRIAEDAAWLLRQLGLTGDPHRHRETHISLLAERGFVMHSGRVSTEKLVRALRAYYPSEFLERAGCGLERKYNWAHRLVHNIKRAQHPIPHLLLIHSLGYSVARLFEQSISSSFSRSSCHNCKSDSLVVPEDQITASDISLLSEAEDTLEKAASGNIKKRTRIKLEGLSRVESYRKRILAARAEEPDAGRSRLREKVGRLYRWLENNDRAWLETHLPPRQKPAGPPRYIDWAERDREIAKAIKAEAAHMRNESGRPIRVSQTSVANRIGKLAVITKRRDLLPLSVKALEEIAESVEEYAVRRVLWAAESYREEGYCPSSWQLQIRAAVSLKIAKKPKVNATIEATILSLQQDVLVL